MIASDHCGAAAVIDHHDDFFFPDGHYPVIFAKCAWNPTDSAQYGVGRDFLIFDIVHYGSGDQGNQYGSI